MKGDCEYSVVGYRVEKDRETGQGLAKSKLSMTEANFMKNSTFRHRKTTNLSPVDESDGSLQFKFKFKMAVLVS